MAPVVPGSTIGILGGGQLGRMTALAARAMGYRVHTLDPDPDCAALPVSDRVVTARFDDADAAADLARHCDVITLEIEQIDIRALESASRYAPVRPSIATIAMIQDRSRQKAWLADHDFPLGAYRDVCCADDLAAAARDLGPLFAKANRGGYDGRSQARVASAADAPAAWTSLRGRPAVAEATVDLAAEVSVMVARSPSGEVRVFPPALNHHERQVLAWSVIPAMVEPKVAGRAGEIALGIATALKLEGVLAVEMFITGSGDVLVNELAPRPHNSFHETEAGCATSQFEQFVRAVCDLPLGDPSVVKPAAIVNLFGDLWTGDTAPAFERALRHNGVRVHLYGKRSARPGRKMGHLSALGASPDEALALALLAFRDLTT